MFRVPPNETSSVFYAGDGTVSLPSYAFASDLDSGFYRIGANNIGLALNGVLAVNFATTSTAFAAPISFSAGVAITGASYSMGRDNTATNIGYVNVPTSAPFQISQNGVAKLYMTPAGNILIGTTSIVGPSSLEVVSAAIIGSGTATPISLGVISASGEALTGALYGSRSSNVVVLPSTNTALGKTTQLLYQNIGTYLSALEITGDLTKRVGTLQLMKGGGEVTVGTSLQLSPQERTPEVCTAGTPTAGGSVDDGTHSYKITFVTPTGESAPSATSNVITTSGGNNTVPLTAIAKGGARCTARNIYRRVAGDTGNWKYVGQIANNTATTYSDTLADGSLGADAPSTNTTNNAISGVTGGLVLGSRVNQSQGTDIASATLIAIPSDGNVFELTGTTAVTLISNIGFKDGIEVTLVANESVVITNGTATSGTDITIKLAGAGNYSMTAEDTLTLVLCSTTATGQAWREKARSVN